DYYCQVYDNGSWIF
nr:immunoglobulin light chain junction region [Macaca mulatta]